jgi:hypothetical protein
MGRAFEHSVGVLVEGIALARMVTASFFVLIKALQLRSGLQNKKDIVDSRSSFKNKKPILLRMGYIT